MTIPRDRVRLHLCWGNYDGPHTHDVPLEPLLPILYRAKVGSLSLPLASPRHQHELKAFRQHPLPNHMLFLPGVIDSTTNVVEHPEVVADRITAAVAAVGDRTRVLASVDCGFGTFAGSMLVEESVVWTKLRTFAKGRLGVQASLGVIGDSGRQAAVGSRDHAARVRCSGRLGSIRRATSGDTWRERIAAPPTAALPTPRRRPLPKGSDASGERSQPSSM